MDLDEFRRAFSKIRAMGWVKSTRRGDTGIGHTLETLLGISENNIALPDLGTIELKAHRIHSSSMVTLFTFNRKAWRMNPLDAVRKYGTPDDTGRLGMYFTMSQKANSAGLYLYVGEEKISVRHVDDGIVAEWKLEDLANRFLQKLPAMILVSAFSEMRGDREWFKFERAQLMKGTSASILRSQIQAGNVLIDLRLHDKGTRVRNHGTGFRVLAGKLPLLFTSIEDL
jgi:hypothetical protein